jgi:hypothetical protein
MFHQCTKHPRDPRCDYEEKQGLLFFFFSWLLLLHLADQIGKKKTNKQFQERNDQTLVHGINVGDCYTLV